MNQPTRRRDVLNYYLVFRSAITGRYVSRWYAFRHKDTTVSEKRKRRP